ncbi:hypothetical protein N7492_010336 [Penicillium capsulatum]|uniref:DNA polymerase n=1 Tax=Penicillium capsulatum TaxID=69766 RepID=A0A9W9HPH8_9EURO|nr:hypothetical protein N7492_010336 [Penicillium capsulatum]KAJ6112841.1 hypothetical protein N7512_008165 [Penicillium capsulatum]
MDNPSKTSFFTALEQLDDLDDITDDEEEDHLERLIASSRPFYKQDRAATLDLAPSEPAPLLRANSDPQTASADPEHSKAIVVEEMGSRRSASLAEPKLGPVQRSQTTGSMREPKAGCPPPSKKRRIDNSKEVPKGQQIFKGLVFFFFPNNDTSPLRRLRIQRVQEYGARWAREWNPGITHVIVEKELLFNDLLTHLKLESLPTNVILVNETYPSDCIRFRSVLSPLQARFCKRTTTGGVFPVSYKWECTPGSPASGAKFNESASDPAPTRERDALDTIIEEALAVQHLPLDPLESPQQSDADESDTQSTASDSEAADEPPPRKDRQDVESWAQSFACMQKYEPNARRNNSNSRTIEVLQQMLDYYTRMGDHWRTFAYRKAINALYRQPHQIRNRTQALSVAGIGPRLADMIEEIVLTDHLRRLDHANGSSEDRIIQEFLGVYGAGLSQASKWVAQGYRSLSDLRDRASLTTNQRIGVERYHDFAQRISRKEVEAHGAIVRQAIQQVDSDMQVIIAGSYRRGAHDSGDIDLLITKPDASVEQIRTVVLDTVVPELFRQRFLQVGLAASRRGHDGSKWHGASTLPGSTLWRRIDLLFVPGVELGAALIYFTGNDIFNRSMRLLARKKGMCLNQRGLFSNVLRDAQREKTNPGRLVESRDEKRIFELLGVPWRRPEHRIC